MFDFLKRSDNNESGDNPFRNWTALENVPLEEGVFPDVFRQPALEFHTGITVPSATGATTAAIVIGLGRAGEVILRGWLKRIQESGSLAHDARSYWLYHNQENQPDLPLIAGRQRQINIQLDGASGVNGALSSREAMHACLNQAAVYERLKDHLMQDAKGLNEKIRVFVVASAREPIVGILGDVLQLLSLLSSENVFRQKPTVSCILTLDGITGESELSDAETFAVVREISRLTFKGLHVMPPAIGEHTGLLRGDALGFLFIVEAPVVVEPPSQTNARQTLPFETGSAEISADSIYALTHPSGEKIWGDLINCLTTGTTIQHVLQTPLVYGLNSATLYLPLVLLQRYATLRLVKAMLFSEKIDSGEGLLTGYKEEPDIESLASSWLTANPKAKEHQFFLWLLKARQSPRPLPPFISGESYARAFKQRLCNQLNLYLNSRAGNIKSVHQVITWLQKLHAEISTRLDQNPALKSDKSAISERPLRDYISAAQGALENVERELVDWMHVFNPGILRGNTSETEISSNQTARPTNPFEASSTKAPLNNPFVITTDAAVLQPKNNPFEDLSNTNNSVLVLAVGTRAEEKLFTLPELEKQIQAAYQALVKAGNAPISRSVIQKTDGSDEIENTYLEIIRPELINSAVPSPYFERMRARLGWWVATDNVHGDLRIKIVALPSTWQTTDERPTNAAFPVQRVNDFYNRLFEICTQEMRSLKLKFNDRQFSQTALEKKNFLSRAGEICIRYDRTRVAYDRQHSSSEAAAQSFGYLLYKPTETRSEDDFRKAAFDGLMSAQSRDVHWSENCVTALHILTNLPAWRIDVLSSAQPRYRSAMFRHLYTQESNALEYERRAHDERNEDVLFSPRTCMLLANAELVRLFFRVYLAGFVQLTFDNNGLQARKDWAVVDVPMLEAPEPAFYPPLFLNTHDSSTAGLWEALEAFALHLPNRPRIEISPSDPFHRDMRQYYFQALDAAARERMKSSDYQERRKMVRNQILVDLDKASKANPRAGDLACLIRLELNSLV